VLRPAAQRCLYRRASVSAQASRMRGSDPLVARGDQAPRRVPRPATRADRAATDGRLGRPATEREAAASPPATAAHPPPRPTAPGPSRGPQARASARARAQEPATGRRPRDVAGPIALRRPGQDRWRCGLSHGEHRTRRHARVHVHCSRSDLAQYPVPVRRRGEPLEQVHQILQPLDAFRCHSRLLLADLVRGRRGVATQDRSTLRARAAANATSVHRRRSRQNGTGPAVDRVRPRWVALRRSSRRRDNRS